MISKDVARAMKARARTTADKYFYSGGGHVPNNRLREAQRRAKQLADRYIEDPNAPPVLVGVDYGSSKEFSVEVHPGVWGVEIPTYKGWPVSPEIFDEGHYRRSLMAEWAARRPIGVPPDYWASIRAIDMEKAVIQSIEMGVKIESLVPRPIMMERIQSIEMTLDGKLIMEKKDE